MSRRASGSRIGRSLFLALLIFLSFHPASPAAESQPVRLHLTVAEHVVAVGDSIPLKIEFQNRDYEAVANDRERLVSLGQAPASSRAGRGEISPQEVTVEAGALAAEVRFEATEPGRVMITAESEGLTPAQLLLSLRPRQRSWWSEIWDNSAYAQQPAALELLFLGNKEELPANGKTSALFHVLLDTTGLEPDRKVRVRLDTSSGILRKEEEEQAGFVIELSPQMDMSEEIYLRCAEPGTARVSATVVPGGQPVVEEVTFVAVRPEGIVFSGDLLKIPSEQMTVPLTVRLVDRDRIVLTVLEDEHDIDLSSLTDAAAVPAVELRPATVTLGPGREVARPMLEFSRFPGGDVKLLARDRKGELNVGEMTIQLTSRIRALGVSGPKVVRRSTEGNELTLHLLNEEGKHQEADLLRTISVRAERGRVDPASVEIKKGEEHVEVQYSAPATVGQDTVQAEGANLATGVLEIQVGTAISILLTFASFGGLFGGVARQIFKKGVRRILPAWVKGTLQPGLLGHALFSFVLGVMFYLAVKWGLTQGIEAFVTTNEHPYYLESRAFAFFFGVLGGFAGIVLLDRLLERILPERREQESPA